MKNRKRISALAQGRPGPQHIELLPGARADIVIDRIMAEVATVLATMDVVVVVGKADVEVEDSIDTVNIGVIVERGLLLQGEIRHVKPIPPVTRYVVLCSMGTMGDKLSHRTTYIENKTKSL